MHFTSHSTVGVALDLQYLQPHGLGKEVMTMSGGADSTKTVNPKAAATRWNKSCSNKMEVLART